MPLPAISNPNTPIKKSYFVVKKQKNSNAGILNAINQLTENDITQFRNTAFDNAAVELLTTGHRRSFEFLDQIVLKDQNKFEGNLINDLEGLSILKDYFVLAEDYLRDGRLNKVSMAYVEAARYPHFADLYWLQELILDKALEAASKYKADGGKQLAFCQILLSEMLESMKVRKLRQKNMIWGKDYMTSVPKKCHEILESCLEKSTGRSHWALPDPNNQKQIPFELISAGHLARLKLADNISDESNLKRAIKLSEQANCQWLISLSNYYLAKFLVDHDRKLEAVVRLEKGLNIINKQNQDSEIWSNENTCMQAPSLDRLAGMNTILLCQIKLAEREEVTASNCLTLLEDYLNKFDEKCLERANVYNLLGEIYDRYFNKPEMAVDCYNQAFQIQPTYNSTRVNIGISNGHMILDNIMKLYDNELHESSNSSISKRLLIWKDEPDCWRYDLESDDSN